MEYSDETSLVVKGFDTKSESVFLQLHTGDYLYDDIVSREIYLNSPGINYLGPGKRYHHFQGKGSG